MLCFFLLCFRIHFFIFSINYSSHKMLFHMFLFAIWWMRWSGSISYNTHTVGFFFSYFSCSCARVFSRGWWGLVRDCFSLPKRRFVFSDIDSAVLCFWLFFFCFRKFGRLQPIYIYVLLSLWEIVVWWWQYLLLNFCFLSLLGFFFFFSFELSTCKTKDIGACCVIVIFCLISYVVSAF